MTDTELVEALAAKLKAYSTADPLKSVEVHPWPQIGYEEKEGSLTLQFIEGRQTHIGIGEQLMDSVSLRLYSLIPHADTQTGQRNLILLREQIVEVLRRNRALSAGNETTRANSEVPITWVYGPTSEGEVLNRWCAVMVTYDKAPDGLA